MDTSQAYQVMPPHTPEQYEALKADIAMHGVQEPIDVDEEGQTLDGFARDRICRELGIECPKHVVQGLRTEAEKRDYAWRMNLLRRQLTPKQKRGLAKQLRLEGKTEKRIAEWLGVSQAAVSNWLRDMIKSDELQQPITVEGEDGKYYPTDKLMRRKTKPGASIDPVEAQIATTAVDPVHATSQVAEEAPPDEANADRSMAAPPATGPRRQSPLPSQASTAVTQILTTDAVASLMDDLSHALESQWRRGELKAKIDAWDAEARARWQVSYRRLKVQLRPLGVALGIESRSRPQHMSPSHPAPGHPAETSRTRAPAEPAERADLDFAALKDEPDTEAAELLPPKADVDDSTDCSKAADGVLEIPSEETLDNLQEVEL
jgi:ParB-like chromosome segregation protein Spo0J